MFYTYILQSIPTPSKRYVGHTSNLKIRLAAHNAGGCPATRRHRPWRVKVFIAFETRLQAHHFESYLKTGSGRSFANRHFWADPQEPNRPTPTTSNILDSNEPPTDPCP